MVINKLFCHDSTYTLYFWVIELAAQGHYCMNRGSHCTLFIN